MLSGRCAQTVTSAAGKALGATPGRPCCAPLARRCTAAKLTESSDAMSRVGLPNMAFQLIAVAVADAEERHL